MANCTVCGKRAYSDYCVAHKPRKPIAVKSVPKQNPHCNECGSDRHYTSLCPTLRKTIKPKGKEAANWYKFKVQWMKEHEGSTIICHYCSKVLKPDAVTLDHKIPRSRAPHLRYEPSNLVPCCFTCNGLKGSIEHDKYDHVCHS